MRKTRKLLALTLAAALAFSLFISPASADASGDGTPASPLLISTEAELLGFKARVAGGEIDLYAELTADISVTAAWTSIGSANTAYCGVFDGGGHTLTLSNTAAPGGTALFHTVAAMGMVKNLKLDVTFAATSIVTYIAGVAAYNYGTIANVTVDGAITSSGGYIAGIAGSSDGGRFFFCVNNADITGSYPMAGIAGKFTGEMRYCANTGAINYPFAVTTAQIAGLAGGPTLTAVNVPQLLISDSYNAGTVTTQGTASATPAGLLGSIVSATLELKSDVNFENLFSFGETTDSDSKGYAISNTSFGNGEGCYTTSTANYHFSNTYYLEDIGQSLFSTNSKRLDMGFEAEILPSAIDVRTAERFASQTMADELNAGRTGANAPWEYVAGSPYPTLKAPTAAQIDALEHPVPPAPKAFTVGSKQGLFDAFNIIKAAGRQYDGTITLTADIDLSGQEWAPIENFNGVFDGTGHTIKGLTINKTETSANVGFFANIVSINKDAVVRNVSFINASINAPQGTAVGIVAGTLNIGTIENVFVSDGSVSGLTQVGGIVGNAKGVISKCGSDVSVTASDKNSTVGGIAGIFGQAALTLAKSYSISDVYSTGSVSSTSSAAPTYVGGLVGRLAISTSTQTGGKTVTISNAFTTSTVTTTTNGTSTGVAIGQVYNSVAVNGVYYKANGGLSGFTSSGAGANEPTGKDTILVKTDDEFKSLAATLNASRTGNDAPWTDGTDHPTLDFSSGAESVSSIAISKPPAKTVYAAGDALDLTGLQVTATLSGGGAGVITSGYTTDPANGAELTATGTTTVTVTYQGKTATFGVTVGAALALAAEIDAGVGGAVSGGGNYAAGATVTVKATPDFGYVFAGWTATAEGVTLDSTTANPLTFTMPGGAVTLTAKFDVQMVPVPWGIDNDAGFGGVIVGAEGSNCAVRVNETGYVIDTISVDGKRLSIAGGLTSFTTTTAPKRSIFATFTYTVNFNTPANGTLSVSRGAETLTSGSIVRGGEILTITAAAASGYTINNLALDGLTHISGDEYKVTASKGVVPAITAEFKVRSSQGITTDPATTTPSNTDTGTAVGGGVHTAPSSESTPSVVATETVEIKAAVDAATGKATAEVTPESAATAIADAKKAVEEAKAGGETNVVAELVIAAKAEAAQTVKASEIGIAAEVIQAIADAGDIILTVESDVSTVTLDAAALTELASGLASGDTVTLTAESVDSAEALSERQQAAAGGNPVLELNITAGGAAITTFGGAVTVQVPYTPKAETAAADYDLLTVYHLAADGGITEMQGARYNAATGKITFTTTHFSKFFISEWINPFGDIAKGEWFYKAARYAYSNALITGTTDTTFAPQTTLTRAMLATILYRNAVGDGVHNVPSPETTFTDVAPGQWYTDAIAWASSNNLITGIGNNKFAPNDPITREQFATLLYRYTQWSDAVGDGVPDVPPSGSTDLSGFTDAETISDWAQEAMSWAVSTGLVTGRTPTTLTPQIPATRAEAAMLLQRYLETIA